MATTTTTTATTAARATGRRRRRRLAAALSLAAAGLACYDGGLVAVPDPSSIAGGRGGGGPSRRRSLRVRRRQQRLRGPEVDSDPEVRGASPGEGEGGGGGGPPGPGTGPLPPYTLADAVRESDAWESAFAVLVYDAPSDKFVGLHSSRHRWMSSSKKLLGSMNVLANLLRRTLPSKFSRGPPQFNRGAPEFAVAIGSGDYPHVKPDGLPRAGGAAPVLQFGSTFRDGGLYPSMIPMPMPGGHLNCFGEWARLGRVCETFRRASDESHHYSADWDDLIPQVIWRGTDFGYLGSLHRPQKLRPVDDSQIKETVVKRRLALEGERDKKMAAAQTLRENYDQLLPRWQGVVLTAEAELEADLHQGQAKLPWANIKFSRYVNKGSLPFTIDSEKYRLYDEVGIATGKYMERRDLAKYRYHIDLGGGGGTTWTGTVDKLAMPGLLFHHVTPTKDYVHDRLEAWTHYVPVAPDLSDLREKFDWAEAHPAEAREIAARATAFVRDLATPEGFGRMFDEDLAAPLRRIVEAYSPVAEVRPGATWRDVLRSPEGGGGTMVPVVECSGFSNLPASCRAIGGDAVAEREDKGNYTRGSPA